MSHIAHRTNQVVKTLTIVSTLLLPMSVIFGFCGVNNLGGVSFLEQSAGFGLMLVVTEVSGGALLYFFRQGWPR